MSKVLFISVLAFIFFTYKLVVILKNEETPKGNRRIAWLFYSFCVVGLVIANTYFYYTVTQSAHIIAQAINSY